MTLDSYPNASIQSSEQKRPNQILLSNEDKYLNLAFGLTLSKVSRDTWDFKGDFKGDLEDDLFFNSLELDTELVGFDLIIIKIKIYVFVSFQGFNCSINL